MQTVGFTLEEIIDSVPSKEKLEIRYLKGNVDKAIADLVYNKIWTRTAFNYYLGKRDDTQLAHLTDNYGVGVPTEIPNMRLMSKRINALIGMMMQNNLDYHVTAQNAEAISIKAKEKKNKILVEIQKQVESTMQQGKKDPINEEFLERLKNKYGETYKADFEVAAHDYLEYYKDKFEIRDFSRRAAENLSVTGEIYWRTYIKEEGTDPITILCDPRDFFYEMNPNSVWIEDCRRVVHRRYLNPQQILNEYGHLLDDHDLERVARSISSYYNERYQREVMFVEGKFGERIAIGDTPRYMADLVEVYHVEWIATDEAEGNTEVVDLVESKVKNVKTKNKRRLQNRYEGVRIELGGGIYVGLGKSKFISRSVQNPFGCKLTYNGIVYKGNISYLETPFSLVMATKDLADMFDVAHFHLNNLLATARPGGTIVPLEYIPKEFGDTPEERLLKFTGYLKTLSYMPISLSQEGNEGEFAFNNFGSYNPNLDGPLIQAMREYIMMLEEQADRIIGLNPQMMGEIEERSGKGTTLQAIKQGELVVKELLFLHMQAMRKVLIGVVNMSRMSYNKKPLLASYSIGDNYRIFTIGAENYSLCDFNVQLVDDAEETQMAMKADELVNLAIQNQTVRFKEAFDLITAKSLQRKRQTITRAENSQHAQLMQQMQQMQQQLEELEKQNKQLTEKAGQLQQLDAQLKQKEIELKERKLKSDEDIKLKEIELKKEIKETKKEIDEQKIQVQKAELFDNNPRNDSYNWSK